MRRDERGELAWAAGITVAVPLLGTVLTGHANLLATTLPALELVLLGMPLLVFALFGYAMRTWRARTIGWRWFFRTLAVAELALQLILMLLVMWDLSHDAQGPVALLFAPFYAHAGALIAATAAGIVGALRDRTTPRARVRRA